MITYKELEENFPAVITRHDLDAEAGFIADSLNQDVWVIKKILREYWSDRLALEWTVQDIEKSDEFTDDLTHEDAIQILKNTSVDYSKSWGLDTEDIADNIEVYKDWKKNSGLYEELDIITKE